MPGTPPGQQRDCAANACLPFWISSFHLFTTSCAQGCRMGLCGSPMRGTTVQPWPLRQNGNLGSFFTGPGPPLTGGRKSKLAAAQPILLEEKSGTPEGRLEDGPSAATAAPAAAQRPTAATRLAIR